MQSFKNYYGRSAKRAVQDASRKPSPHPDFAKVVKRSQDRFKRSPTQRSTTKVSERKTN